MYETPPNPSYKKASEMRQVARQKINYPEHQSAVFCTTGAIHGCIMQPPFCGNIRAVFFMGERADIVQVMDSFP
jgi:hypothetical protein